MTITRLIPSGIADQPWITGYRIRPCRVAFRFGTHRPRLGQ